MKHKSTKTYGNDRGFSCAFRQALADSHCSLIHGYRAIDPELVSSELRSNIEKSV